MNEDIEVKKAIIPAAGKGTRMLSVAGTIPKEMLSIGNKCMIEYSVKEALDSGIRQIYVIINKKKNMIRDFLLDKLRHIFLEGGRLGPKLIFLYQEEPRGVADAYLLAKEHMGDEPFAVLVPDNITISHTPVIKQLINVFKRYKKDLFGVIRVDESNARFYYNCGEIEYNTLEKGVFELTRLCDKKEGTFSLEGKKEVMRGIARYVCTHRFFDYLEKLTPNKKGELDDVPAFQEMARDRAVLGVMVEGKVFDAGHPAGYSIAKQFLREG